MSATRKQRFIDHRFIDAARDVELTVNPPAKLPGPVLHSEHPWEAFSIGWSCVLEDDGLFRLWYAASDSDQSRSPIRSTAIRRWSRPASCAPGARSAASRCKADDLLRRLEVINGFPTVRPVETTT